MHMDKTTPHTMADKFTNDVSSVHFLAMIESHGLLFDVATTTNIKDTTAVTTPLQMQSHLLCNMCFRCVNMCFKV